MDFLAQGRVEQQKIFMIVIIREFLFFHLWVVNRESWWMKTEKLRNIVSATGDKTKDSSQLRLLQPQKKLSQQKLKQKTLLKFFTFHNFYELSQVSCFKLFASEFWVLISTGIFMTMFDFRVFAEVLQREKHFQTSLHWLALAIYVYLRRQRSCGSANEVENCDFILWNFHYKRQ